MERSIRCDRPEEPGFGRLAPASTIRGAGASGEPRDGGLPQMGPIPVTPLVKNSGAGAGLGTAAGLTGLWRREPSPGNEGTSAVAAKLRD